MKYTNQPEVAASTWRVDKSGSDCDHADRVVGVSVYQSKMGKNEGVIQIDVRDLNKNTPNLVIEFCLYELVAAISKATLNADRD
jgi:hypothetical protein